ncbi:MAG: redoxin domain-containing protein [Nitrospirae bacterium]|nr:redoxin domain-containing protein [Nitrospirota bacterium]
MRRMTIAVTVALLWGGVSPALAGTPAGPYKVGDLVTDFALPMLGGETFNLSDHKGKPIVLAFFASW